MPKRQFQPKERREFLTTLFLDYAIGLRDRTLFLFDLGVDLAGGP
jgi:hypothetical protein